VTHVDERRQIYGSRQLLSRALGDLSNGAGSTAECLPRNIGFLYSKNRLNVAVSRAQCLAVVVANPKLLEIPCGTVEQMKLVNTFCWLDEYAKQDYNQKIITTGGHHGWA